MHYLKNNYSYLTREVQMKFHILISRFFRSMLVLLVLCLLGGCSAKIHCWSEESFRSKDFNEEKLQKEGLALLPVIILDHSLGTPMAMESSHPSAPYAPAPGKSAKEGRDTVLSQESNQVILNEMLIGKIQTKRPSFKLMPPGDVLIRLNDKNLPCDFNRFSKHFTKSGPESEQLKCFSKALNSRYLFISQAAVTEYKSDASVTFIWSFGRKSIIRSVNLYGQVWDTQQEKQIWDGFGVGYQRLSAYEGSALFEQMASTAVDSLLKTFIP
jgi:hypothetical protein